jgi:hypothetical protein
MDGQYFSFYNKIKLLASGNRSIEDTNRIFTLLERKHFYTVAKTITVTQWNYLSLDLES